MPTTFHQDLQDIAWFLRPHGQDDPCCGDLTAAEVRALSNTQPDQCPTVQDIARSLGVTRSGATRVVDRLEGRGLAHRCCSSVDRRCTCVEITPTGQAALSDAVACFEGLLNELLAPLPPKQRTDLENSLASLAKLIRDHQEETRTP